MPAQGRDDVVGIRSDDIAELAVRPCVTGNGIDGLSGVPVVKASTSNQFQPNTRSAGETRARPSRDRFAVDPAAIDFEALKMRRTDAVSGGRHSGTQIVPRASVMQASAWARMIPGLANRPPQLPE